MAIISGLVSDLGCVTFKSRNAQKEMVARVAADLVAWRIDDGPVETGRLRVVKTGASAEETEALGALIRPNHLLRVECFKAVDEGQIVSTPLWAFEEVLDIPAGEDPELEALEEEVQLVSPPTEPWHLAYFHQVASCPGDRDTVDALAAALAGAIEALSNQGTPCRWQVGKGRAMSTGTVYFFEERDEDPQPILGARRLPTIQLNRNQDSVTLRAFGSPKVANDRLHRFVEELGNPAAATLGLVLELGDAEVVVPDAKRRAPLDVPGIGTFMPVYSVGRNDLGDLKVATHDYLSEPLRLGPLGGQECRFSIESSALPNAEEAELIGQTMLTFASGSTDVVRGIEVPLYEDHLQWCEHTGNPAEFNRPEQIWPTVVFQDARVRVDQGDDGPVGIIEFQVDLTWASHSFKLTIADGTRWTELAGY